MTASRSGGAGKRSAKKRPAGKTSARKAPAKKPSSRRRPRRRPRFTLAGHLRRVALGIGLLVLICAGLLIALQRTLPPRPPRATHATTSTAAPPLPAPKATPARSPDRPPGPRPTRPPAPVAEKLPPTPTYEVFPAEPLPVPAPTPRPTAGRPRVALIFDDLGYDDGFAAKLLGLDAVMTLAVFPHSPYQDRIVAAARRRGWDVMLHLPMEPVEYPSVDPGPGALLSTMSPDELIEQLNSNLDAIPAIVGVNNHMGSRLTTISTQMYQVFSILRRRGLFFVDSLTTSHSICRPSARLLKVPFAQRDVFLDHRQDPAFIRGQLQRLVRVARRHGQAIGIGHPHHATYVVLEEELPAIKRQVDLVPVAALVQVVQ